MIKKGQILSKEYYKYGGVFTGSLKGMRYKVQKMDEKIKVHVWYEPYCYDIAKKEEMIEEVFEFSKEGLDKAVDWLNETYLTRHAKL